MNCKKCGKELMEKDQFCKFCGSAVEVKNSNRVVSRTWFIVLMLIVFFPVGLYLMWKSNWNKVAKVMVSLVFAIGFIGVIFGEEEEGMPLNDTTTVNAQVASNKSMEEKDIEIPEEPKVPEKTPEEIKQEFISKCERFTYKDIARNPDNFNGKHMKLDGEVIQVSEGLFNSVTLRVSSRKDELGFDEDIYLINYKYSDGESKILEEDNITIWGICSGVTSYKSVLGSTITIPSVDMEYYSIGE